MIIPSIKLPNVSEEINTEILVPLIQRWSLFGSLAIRGIHVEQVVSLESIIRMTAGKVDLYLGFENEENGAIDLLNAGASYVLTKETPTDPGPIPEDKRAYWIAEESPDQSISPGHFVELPNPTSERLAELEMARIDALVEVDLLENDIELIVRFFESVLVSDRPDGLWSTVIVDPLGVALGLAYSSRESLAHAIEHRVGTYFSRSRNDLWIKGETSGATQQLLGVRLDCDRDCLRFQVTQDEPGFCHLKRYTCFGKERNFQSVIQRLSQRMNDDDESSFTRKLATDAKMLRTKLVEEANELAEASEEKDSSEVTWEAADLFYFSLIAMLKHGVSLSDVEGELARRMNRVVRRKNKLESKSS